MPPLPGRPRPVLQYVCLIGLFLIALAYQLTFSADLIRNARLGYRPVDAPFRFAEGTTTINAMRPEATSAGVKRGDRVLAVNGRPIRGSIDWDTVLYYAGHGGTFLVDVARSGATHRMVVPLAPLPKTYSPAALWLTIVVGYTILPFFCILLGFWVALLRPRDVMAWLLLTIMIGFAHVTGASTGLWPEWAKLPAYLFRELFNILLPYCVLLFGLYFPEPFAALRGRLRQVLLVLIPLFLLSALPVFEASVAMVDFAAAAPLHGLVNLIRQPISALEYGLILSFPVCVILKLRHTYRPDARRRLKLLLYGTAIAFVAVLFSAVMNLLWPSGWRVLPGWFITAVLLSILFFPATLAYVIVVQRAMDVRVAIRQGVKYALAQGGLRLVRGGVVVALALLADRLLRTANPNRPQIIAIIATTAAFLLLARRLSERLNRWVDRRFFREAYHAEVVLSELSERVRTMVEPGPMLEYVSREIAGTLHVRRLMVLLEKDGHYQASCALGFDANPDIHFPKGNSTVIQRLQTARGAVEVYCDHPQSWVHRPGAVTGEERSHLVALEAQVLLPLLAKEQLLGFVSLGPKRSEEPYSRTDLRLLQAVAAQTGFALEVARLTEAVANEAAQRERLNREVEIAREVQERLFPQRLPPIAGVEYCGFCRPALGVGGDYYDFLPLPGGKLGIAIGDVAGKGIAAALMMASLQASLRGQVTRPAENLAAVISQVNHLLYEASATNRYATFFYGQYDPVTRCLTYVNAGHNPPIVLRRGSVARLEAGGTVVGLLPSFPYEQAEVTLEPGDVLVGFTDGVSEAMNPAEEEWGEERLIACLQNCCDGTSKVIIDHILASADAFTSGAKQHDDMTLIVMKLAGEVPGGEARSR